MRPPRPCPPVAAYRVTPPAASAPLQRSGRTTLGGGGAADVSTADAPAGFVAVLDERGGRVYLTATASGSEDDGPLAPLADVWLDGAQLRAGVAYSVPPSSARITLAPASDHAVTVSYDVADGGGGGDPLAAVAAAALAAGASDEVRARLREGGVI